MQRSSVHDRLPASNVCQKLPESTCILAEALFFFSSTQHATEPENESNTDKRAAIIAMNE